MAVEIRITGAQDFAKLSKALKEAGRTELRKALNKGIRDGVKPLVPLVRASAAQKLPHRGGLARTVARKPVRVVPRTGANPGVQLVVGRAQQAYTSGRIRHPVFADAKSQTRREWRWVTQQVDPSWFTDTVWDHRDLARRGVEDAMEAVIARIVKETTNG